jgi:hypothetical protein
MLQASEERLKEISLSITLAKPAEPEPVKVIPAPVAAKSKADRTVPVAYSPAFPVRAERLAAKGLDDADIAANLSICETRLMIWCRQYTELDSAILRGREKHHEKRTRLRRPPCPRCGGYVDLYRDRGFDYLMSDITPRCYQCGARLFKGVTGIVLIKGVWRLREA